MFTTLLCCLGYIQITSALRSLDAILKEQSQNPSTHPPSPTRVALGVKGSGERADQARLRAAEGLGVQEGVTEYMQPACVIGTQSD